MHYEHIKSSKIKRKPTRIVGKKFWSICYCSKYTEDYPLKYKACNQQCWLKWCFPSRERERKKDLVSATHLWGRSNNYRTGMPMPTPHCQFRVENWKCLKIQWNYFIIGWNRLRNMNSVGSCRWKGLKRRNNNHTTTIRIQMWYIKHVWKWRIRSGKNSMRQDTRSIHEKWYQKRGSEMKVREWERERKAANEREYTHTHNASTFEKWMRLKGDCWRQVMCIETNNQPIYKVEMCQFR